MAQYYLSDGNTRRGPFPVEQLVAQGLRADSLVWSEGMADWQPAHAVPELRPLVAPQQPQYQQPQYQQPQYQQPGVHPQYVQPQQMVGGYQQPLQYQTPMGAPGESPGLGVTAMVLGILSLLFFWAWCAGLPLGIMGIIFGALGAKKQAGKGMAIAGLVCGCIAVGLSLLILIIWGAMISSL